MSQSRGNKNKKRLTIPGNFKRDKCFERVETDFQIIQCENSGRVGQIATKGEDETPVI